ncbi:unnamed protein product, partial [marine sediment metagenome]
ICISPVFDTLRFATQSEIEANLVHADAEDEPCSHSYF